MNLMKHHGKERSRSNNISGKLLLNKQLCACRQNKCHYKNMIIEPSQVCTILGNHIMMATDTDI